MAAESPTNPVAAAVATTSEIQARNWLERARPQGSATSAGTSLAATMPACTASSRS